MSEILPLAHVKSRFSEVVDRIERTHERVVITRNGRASAVMMSSAELDSLEESLDLLSDPDAMAQIATAREAARHGDYIGTDGLRARFGSTE